MLNPLLILALHLSTPDPNLASQEFFFAVANEAKLLAETSPKLAEAIAHPEGLNPHHYLQRRYPSPEVAREFERHPQGAPLMMSRYLREFVAPLRPTPNLSIQERRALQAGLLWGIGASNHLLAGEFLVQIAPGIRAAPELTDVLHRSMARTQQGPAHHYLLHLVHTPDAPFEARASALRNAGNLRTAEVTETVLKILHQPESPLFRSALSAATVLGSPWGWEAMGAAKEGTRFREEIGLLLVNLIKTGPIKTLITVESRLLTTVAVIATPALRARLFSPLPADKFSEARARLQRAAVRRIDFALGTP